MQKLFLFLLVLIGVWYVRRALTRGAQKAPDQTAQQPAHNATHSENIRECCYCGVLIPESEGVVVNGQFFCSTEHAQALRRQKS